MAIKGEQAIVSSLVLMLLLLPYISSSLNKCRNVISFDTCWKCEIYMEKGCFPQEPKWNCYGYTLCNKLAVQEIYVVYYFTLYCRKYSLPVHETFKKLAGIPLLRESNSRRDPPNDQKKLQLNLTIFKADWQSCLPISGANTTNWGEKLVWVEIWHLLLMDLSRVLLVDVWAWEHAY